MTQLKVLPWQTKLRFIDTTVNSYNMQCEQNCCDPSNHGRKLALLCKNATMQKKPQQRHPYDDTRSLHDGVVAA